MSEIDESGAFIINLEMAIEWKGDEIPDEDTIIAPIKRFVKKTIKAYAKKAKLVNIKTNVYEVGYEEEEVYDDY